MLGGGFIHSGLYVRNNVVLRSLLRVWQISVVINVVSLMSYCMAQCPADTNLRTTAQACFKEYGTQKTYVDRSDQRLYSGIDIEILRAYCSSYLSAVNCVHLLLRECPESSHNTIKEALTDYQDIQGELNDLCRTHGLYELYAQDMTCFASRGGKSEWCFDSKLDITQQYTLNSEELCSKMRVVTQCIEANIRNGCGEQAAELVHLLVKPTVRGSNRCVYTVYQETPVPTGNQNKNSGGTNKTPERVTSTKQQDDTSSAATISSSLLMLICIYISLIFQLYKPRGLS